MYETDLAVLVGAGASIPVGIPGMRGMAQGFEREALSNELKSTWELLTSAGASSDLEELLQAANEIIRLPNTPLLHFTEFCLSPRLRGNTLEDFRRRVTTEVRSVQQFRRSLIRWVSRKCLLFDREKADAIFAPLVKSLADRATPIFTTNYDAVLEEVGVRQGLGIVDNFCPNQYGRNFWDESLASFQREGLRLVHIHGSIQWHATSDGRVEKIRQPAEVNSEGKALEQLLIVPTRFKDIYRRQFFPLYTSFTRTLAKAKLLLVLGHSLRDEYILAAIRERLKQPEFQLIVVDPIFAAEPELEAAIGSEAMQTSVLHLKRPLEDVAPVLVQIVQQPDSGSAFTIAENAIQLLRRRRSDKIATKIDKSWTNTGDRCDLEIKVDTVLATGRVELWMTLESDVESRVPLALVHEGEGEHWAVNAVASESRSCHFTVPDDLPPGRHRLVAALVRPNGEVTVRSERMLGVKKAS